MSEERKENEVTPEEQALGESTAQTAGTPEAAIEGRSAARDPRQTVDSSKKGVEVPPNDEQQVLEKAAEEGVEKADDDQRSALD